MIKVIEENGFEIEIKGLLGLNGMLNMRHHNIDPYPIPKEKSPLYINEPFVMLISKRLKTGDTNELFINY